MKQFLYILFIPVLLVINQFSFAGAAPPGVCDNAQQNKVCCFIVTTNTCLGSKAQISFSLDNNDQNIGASQTSGPVSAGDTFWSIYSADNCTNKQFYVIANYTGSTNYSNVDSAAQSIGGVENFSTTPTTVPAKSIIRSINTVSFTGDGGTQNISFDKSNFTPFPQPGCP